MSSATLLPADAAYVIQCGQILAYPTEAVWGLGCDPFDEQALLNLLALKHRPASKGLILVAANFSDIKDYLSVSEDVTLPEQTERPTTWLMPVNQGVFPQALTGQHEKVAVRISNHPQVKAICEALGGPMVSTSANPSGAQSAKEGFQVRRYFGDKVFYSKGRVGTESRPSQIKDFATGTIIRE